MTQIRIELKAGKWQINGRSYAQLSFADRDLLNDFFKCIKNDVIEFEDCRDKYVEQPLTEIYSATKVFDEAFDFPIK